MKTITITFPPNADTAEKRRDIIQQKTDALKPMEVSEILLEVEGYPEIEWDQQNDASLLMADKVHIIYSKSNI